MPNLKALLACEKVIFDQEGPVSVISIFQQMKVQLTGAPLPEKAISPTLWSVFVLWESDPREVGSQFTQVLKVTAPDGSVFLEHEGLFTNNSVDETQVKTKIQVPGLPIWKEGWITVSVNLKENPAINGEYKFELRYIPPPSPSIVPSAE
jgi:hypothetical protein